MIFKSYGNIEIREYYTNANIQIGFLIDKYTLVTLMSILMKKPLL